MTRFGFVLSSLISIFMGFLHTELNKENIFVHL